MIRKTFVLKNEQGLHSRAAAQFVKTTSKYDSDIFIEKGSYKLNAKSIMGILSFGISPGEEITISVDGKDEEEAMDDIEKLLESL